ncbi:6015_t:CDS:2, partial [Acaulospora colombiana]
EERSSQREKAPKVKRYLTGNGWKTVLEEGISGDADFLASSNIMDYSYVYHYIIQTATHLQIRLLLGGRLLGSYTFAKTLEYKAKQNIQKEVT